MSGAAILAIAGGLFEILGLGLVVAEIASDRRRARQLLQVEGRIQSVPPGISVESAGKVTAIGGRRPTLEERVERLEGRVEALNVGMMTQTDRLRAEIEASTTEAIEKAYRETLEKDQALRRFLHQQLSGGVSRRLTGVMLFALGAILSGGANLLAAS